MDRSGPWPTYLFRHDAAWLRMVAHEGAQRCPIWCVKTLPLPLGLFFWATLPSYRRAILANVRRVNGQQPPCREQLEVAETFVNYAHCLAESLALGRADLGEPETKLADCERLERLLEGQQGLVLVTAHVGSWDLAAYRLVARYGRSVRLVMGPESDPRAVAFHDGLRQKLGVSVVRLGEDPTELLDLRAHLLRGGVVAFQLDRLAAKARGLSVRLFGEVAELPLGPFRLAAASQVPLVAVFCARVSFWDYEVRVGTVESPAHFTSPEQLAEAGQRVAAALESFVRRWPAQWFDFGMRKEVAPRGTG